MNKILAIDDNLDNLISIKAIIKDAFPDALIDTALNGPMGIELALAKDPDVILLDILMPEMDGFEVCRKLKQDYRLRDIPVVFLTAVRDRKESRIEALEIGAEAFLTKPIDISELTAQIRAMVKIKGANKRKKDEKEHLAMLVAERTCELEEGRVEMIRLMDDLIKAKEKAEESDSLKSAFLANMSHEIRTPLNCIIGFSDLMLEPDFDQSKMVEFARMINAGGCNMLSIINDIMDISKIETGQLTLKKCAFPVSELVVNVQEELSYKASEKGLELKVENLSPQNQIEVNSDENKLKQILLNLVGNAIKFSKKGIVEIGIKMKGEFLLFHVKDMGIGIDKEFHEKIFDRFCQVESDYTREYGGNGLGLAISKSLVHLLGGEIWVESEVGKGSVFYFTIPI